MGYTIVWGNIVDEKTDALVTPADRAPRIGEGLDSVVHAAAGSGLLKARAKLGDIGPGDVRITRAYGLAKRVGARHVLHALGPVFEEGDRNEAIALDACYLRILLAADKLGARVVSLPVMSSGRFGMPMALAMDTAVGAIETYLSAHRRMAVKLVVIDEAFYAYALSKWPGKCVRRLTRQEAENYRRAHPAVSRDEALRREKGLGIDEPLAYFRDVMARAELRESPNFNIFFKKLWDEAKSRDKKAYGTSCRARDRACSRDYLLNNQSLADKTGITPRSIRHFCSTVKSVCPSKDKVLALAVAMRLDLAYAKALLSAAGHKLGDGPRDALVAGFVERRTGDVGALNEALRAAGMESLAVAEKPDCRAAC